MISAGEFRNGVTFDMDGNVFQIIEFQHVKPGKGAAFVRTKIRNVISGAVVERTFSPTEKFPTAYIERKDMQYLYSDGDLYEIVCPSCGDSIYLDEGMVDEGEMDCPNCGEHLEFDFDDEEEESEEDDEKE